ncbi:MAG: hypothetical protein EAZ91_13975 [Cytophagales bacterium]|nr:MAG: hypothetical protein EAZ91_13975 [Cytophagales bacterium]
MELPIETLEQIEDYITHQLPDNQRRAIEHRMEQDPHFRETVEGMRRTRSFIDRTVRLDTQTQERLITMARAVMTDLDARNPMQKPLTQTRTGAGQRPRRAAFWGFAMAALVLLMSGLYLAISPVQLANADLDAGMHRDAQQAPTNTLRPAERQALDDFLAANAFYTNGEFGKAIAHYERAADAPISAYLKEAIWYNLSLACLKAGHIQKAQQYWKQYEATLDQPHYPSSFLDRTRIRTRLLLGEIFS